MQSKFRFWLFSIALNILVYSCSATALLSKKSEPSGHPGAVVADSLPVDPWSLGPDVFAQDAPTVQTAIETQSVKTEPDPSVPAVAMTASEMKPLSRPTTTAQQALPTEARPVVTISEIDSFFTVQVGTFLDRTKASEFAARASTALGLPGIVQFETPFYRLRFGELATREQADSLHRVAMSRGFYDARVLRLSNP